MKKHTEYMRVWREKNRQKVQEYQKRYSEAYLTEERREVARKRAREWYANNKEEAKKRINQHYHENKQLVGRPQGDKHHAWKGEDASYFALHSWVSRKKGRPQECEHCGTKEKRHYHWANLDGKYTRDLNTWVRLCVPCHSKHDKKLGFDSIKNKYGSI